MQTEVDTETTDCCSSRMTGVAALRRYVLVVDNLTSTVDWKYLGLGLGGGLLDFCHGSGLLGHWLGG